MNIKDLFDIKPGDTIVAIISPKALSLTGTPLAKQTRVRVKGQAVACSLHPRLQIQIIVEGKSYMPWVEPKDILEVIHTAPPDAEFRYTPVAGDDGLAVHLTPAMQEARMALRQVTAYAGRAATVAIVRKCIGADLRYMTPGDAIRVIAACEAALVPYAADILADELKMEGERARATAANRSFDAAIEARRLALSKAS